MSRSKLDARGQPGSACPRQYTGIIALSLSMYSRNSCHRRTQIVSIVLRQYQLSGNSAQLMINLANNYWTGEQFEMLVILGSQSNKGGN